MHITRLVGFGIKSVSCKLLRRHMILRFRRTTIWPFIYHTHQNYYITAISNNRINTVILHTLVNSFDVINN